MKERSKIDLQSNRLSRFNRWYLLKTLFYVSLIIGLIAYMVYALNQKREDTPKEEIRDVEIEL